MSSSVGATGQSSSSSSSTQTNAFDNLDTEQFLKLFITELQNQDPLNPMDNEQMLNQMSQIRAIESNTKLTNTLDAVRLGQSVSTAASLIGKTITALPDGTNATKITGKVDRVSVIDGVPKLMIGSQSIDLNNVAEIVDATSG
jgi:flagellar basal-body rod modification protein FlgD